jgi:methyl-accepting chemotaxis protein
MNRSWSFGRKIGLGFAVAVALTLLVGGVAVYSLRQVVESKDHVLNVNAAVLIDAQRLEAVAEQRVSALRGFIIVPEPHYLDDLARSRLEAEALIAGLLAKRPELGPLLNAVQIADTEFRQEQDSILSLVRGSGTPAAIERAFIDDLRPKRRQLRATVEALTSAETLSLETSTQASNQAASSAVLLVISIVIVAAVFAALMALGLTQSLARQIGSAVGQVQSSSAELQAAANQQATGLREQATAMTEITTTISELLTTSRQIAESAQRVAQMAALTAGSARSGDETVVRAHESIAVIQRQVELIVNHMLELGRKSQQIGTVLEIVSELAEQTNILAINATIEASGAGESGRRFAVVADEIRKLADRVASSTKEIRRLIDEVRSAVNTTVMATETGSKTVEAGSRQFGEVASSLRQITGLVGTTTEAAREIELSTKQQSTAVEQVNVAIANVAQASKETETSASQTLQTAVQLASLSKELLRVVQPRAA